MKPLLSGYEKSRWEHSLTCLAFFATPGLVYYIFGYQKMMKVRLNIQLMTFIGYSVFGPIWNNNFTNKLFPEKNWSSCTIAN